MPPSPLPSLVPWPTPDPVVASLAEDIFKELSHVEACQAALHARLVPTLMSIMHAAADKVPQGLCSVSQSHEASCLCTDIAFSNCIHFNAMIYVKTHKGAGNVAST